MAGADGEEHLLSHFPPLRIRVIRAILVLCTTIPAYMYMSCTARVHSKAIPKGATQALSVCGAGHRTTHDDESGDGAPALRQELLHGAPGCDRDVEGGGISRTIRGRCAETPLALRMQGPCVPSQTCQLHRECSGLNPCRAKTAV